MLLTYLPLAVDIAAPRQSHAASAIPGMYPHRPGNAAVDRLTPKRQSALNAIGRASRSPRTHGPDSPMKNPTFKCSTITTLAVVTMMLAACGDKPAEPTTVVAPPPPQPTTVEAPKPAEGDSTGVPAMHSNPGSDLAARVKKALEADANVAGQGIDVTVAAGAVKLWGTVGTETERAHAGSVASGVSGVTSVENRLVVVKGS